MTPISKGNSQETRQTDFDVSEVFESMGWNSKVKIDLVRGSGRSSNATENSLSGPRTQPQKSSAGRPLSGLLRRVFLRKWVGMEDNVTYLKVFA